MYHNPINQNPPFYAKSNPYKTHVCTSNGTLPMSYSSTPVAQLAPRNLLTRWDVSSIPANGIFLTKNKKKTKKKMPNGWRTINSLVHKFDFTVDEGKEWLNHSRDKNQGTHRRRKVD